MFRSSGIVLRTMPAVLMTALMLLTNGRSVLAAPAIQGDVAVVAGYRVDTLDWNIAGDDSGHNPDIMSELTWKDLQIYQFGLTGNAESVGPEFATFSPCMRAVVGYGRIVSGNNQDSDYLGDNRTLEFSRSNDNAGDGSVLDLSFAGGGKAHFRDNRYTLAPLLGFSYYAQNLTASDGDQTLSDPVLYPGVPPLGPFPGLHSTYEAAWYGPWLGLDATAVPGQGWNLSAGIELHQVFYQAEANWNMRADLAHPKSFEHQGNGYGLICRLGSSYALTSRLALTVAAELRNFAIRNGTDRVFLTDGSQGTTRLNGVNWQSQMLTAGVLYSF
jgi:hypothetical protein